MVDAESLHIENQPVLSATFLGQIHKRVLFLTQILRRPLYDVILQTL